MIKLEEIILQVWYKKKGIIKYTSHRDLINTFYIAMGRLALPVVYTEGFSKKPKIAFAPPLPLGVASNCEFANIHFKKPLKLTIDEIREKLNRSFPDGYEFYEAKETTGAEIREMMAKIYGVKYSYKLEFETTAEIDAGRITSAVLSRVASISSEKEIIVSHNEKNKDIRPYILECGVSGKPSETNGGCEIELSAVIAFKDMSTIRPQFLFDYLLADIRGKVLFTYDIIKEKILY